MQPIAPGEGFECRSGCFSPEACINALQIRALDVAREGLSATIGDRSTVETIKLVNGNLDSITARAAHLEAQDAALYEACGLYRLEKDGLITKAVEISDMPPLD